MNLSFAGCGFLGLYHIGVASAFREYAPHLCVGKISGASAGSLAACGLICEVPFGESTSDMLRVAVKARSRALGPFHPGFDINKILHDGLNKLLPEDAHIKCSGKLHVSVTRVSDRKNILLSQFDTRDDLIQALKCSCFIPFYSGLLPPKHNGVAYVDGCFSDNLPVLDDNTITVSPFSGESDICPSDGCFNILQIHLANTSIALSGENLYRFARILFPPHPEVLSRMCQQGFDDALIFLQKHDLISCTRCLAVQSSFVVAETDSGVETEVSTIDSDVDHPYDGCSDCKERQEKAVLDSLPEAVVKAIQDACDQVNKGVISWLFRHRPMKLLSFLTLPYVLPVDITIVVFCKLWQVVPKIQKHMQASFENFMNLAMNLVGKLEKKRHLYSAKFSCQLAITEFNYNLDEAMAQAFSLPAGQLPKSFYKKHLMDHDFKSRSLENLTATLKESRVQRKSYAGQPHLLGNQQRKVVTQPERVISTMNFGFTVNLNQTLPLEGKQRKRSVMEAFKSLGDDGSDISAIEIANKALNWERECIERCQADIEPQNVDTFEQILDVTNKQDALMAYYYMDEDMKVKVTEIFNVTDADTSAVLGKEERESNSNLQWDSEVGTELLGSSLFNSSQLECMLSSSMDEFKNDLLDIPSTSVEHGDSGFGERFMEQSPFPGRQDLELPKKVRKRKTSFIIVN